MRSLVSHDLTFYYSTFKKEAIEYVVNEIKSKSKPIIIAKKNVNSSGSTNSKGKDLLIEEIKYGESEESTNMESDKDLINYFDEVLPK